MGCQGDLYIFQYTVLQGTSPSSPKETYIYINFASYMGLV